MEQQRSTLEDTVLSLNTHTQTLAFSAYSLSMEQEIIYNALLEIIKVMFDFENLLVYKKAKVFNRSISRFLEATSVDRNTNDQLRRAAFSIMLNIAEGSGRYTDRDKRYFYVIARGSTFECVAVFDYLHDESMISTTSFKEYYASLEEISKMLYALIKGLS